MQSNQHESLFKQLFKQTSSTSPSRQASHSLSIIVTDKQKYDYEQGPWIEKTKQNNNKKPLNKNSLSNHKERQHGQISTHTRTLTRTKRSNAPPPKAYNTRDITIERFLKEKYNQKELYPLH